MVRAPIEVARLEQWGRIAYNLKTHRFSYRQSDSRPGEPYASEPVALNIVVTRHCNLSCRYCVAHDFEGIEQSDLTIDDGLIEWINASPFLLLVLTGGEPLLPPWDQSTMRLIDSIENRGLCLDTNGTIRPSTEMIRRFLRKRVLVRVSLDSVRPADEVKVRTAPGGDQHAGESAYFAKLANIRHLVDSGVDVALQTVVWRKNYQPLKQMIGYMAELGIRKWYLQRLIPSHKFVTVSDRNALSAEEYYPVAAELAELAAAAGIECIAKRDLRHNSVLLLTGPGALYTQGSEPGQKLRLGSIHEDLAYFEYVSSADHACRYYLAESK